MKSFRNDIHKNIKKFTDENREDKIKEYTKYLNEIKEYMNKIKKSLNEKNNYKLTGQNKYIIQQKIASFLPIENLESLAMTNKNIKSLLSNNLKKQKKKILNELLNESRGSLKNALKNSILRGEKNHVKILLDAIKYPENIVFGYGPVRITPLKYAEIWARNQPGLNRTDIVKLLKSHKSKGGSKKRRKRKTTKRKSKK